MRKIAAAYYAINQTFCSVDKHFIFLNTLAYSDVIALREQQLVKRYVLIINR